MKCPLCKKDNSTGINELVNQYCKIETMIRKKLQKKKNYGIECDCDGCSVISLTEGDCNEGRWVASFCTNCGGWIEN